MHSSHERPGSVERLRNIISLEHDYCPEQPPRNVHEIADHQCANHQTCENTTCANSQHDQHMASHKFDL